MARTYKMTRVYRSTFRNVKHFGRFRLESAPTVDLVKLGRHAYTSTSGGDATTGGATAVRKLRDLHLY